MYIHVCMEDTLKEIHDKIYENILSEYKMRKAHNFSNMSDARIKVL